MCEGNCLHCPVVQRGHDCTEDNAAEQLAKSMRAAQREHVLEQLRQDTCEKHGAFCCQFCFETSVPVDPVFLDSALEERIRKALSL